MLDGSLNIDDNNSKKYMIMKMNRIVWGMMAFGFSFILAACGSDKSEPTPSPTPSPTPTPTPTPTVAVTEADLNAAVNQYVDGVVLPTYKALAERNEALNKAVEKFRESPSDAAFEDVANAWLDAREPWESGEAFLFGPVADKGLDPNMDSWPLDQVSIAAILNSADWAALEWTGDYDEDDENIEAVQSVRGFHTLEYLTFKDGEPRTVSAKTGSTDPNTMEYADANTDAWANYMQAVAALLRADANILYADWSESYNGGKSYAEIFKAHDGGEGFNSAINCIEQIIDGCADIASEVGASKIGDPVALYEDGKVEEALYAVESWYSWHSRDDYTNNIFSIRNAYYGSLNGTVNSNSLSALVKKVDETFDTKVKKAIQDAADAIQAIPQPFRNNINSAEAKAAMDACGNLESLLTEELKPFMQKILQ